MNNLQAGGWDLSDLKYIQLEPEIKKQLLLKKGDLLFNRTNSKELVGKCDVFSEEGDWAFASYLIRVRLDESRALPLFVSEFLNTRAGRIQIDRVSRQIIGMSNVNAEELRDLLIPLPPLEVQRVLIDEIEAARDERRRKLDQADALLHSLDNKLLAQLGLELPPVDNRKIFAVRLGSLRKRFDVHANHPRFVKLFQNLSSHTFPLVRLQSLAIDIFSGTTPTAGGDAYTDEKQGVPFVRSGEITKDGLIAEKQEIFLRPEIHEGSMKRSRLKKDDLLIAIVGATIGAAGVYDRSTPANINQAIAAVRLNTKRALPEFVRWYLSTSVGQAILDFLKRPVARANINLEEIGEIPVLLPPLELQQNIIEQVNKKRIETRRLQQEAEAEWQAAKRRFEEKLLTGEEA